MLKWEFIVIFFFSICDCIVVLPSTTAHNARYFNVNTTGNIWLNAHILLIIIENSNQSVIPSVLYRYQTKESYSYIRTELNASCHRQAGKTRYQNKIHLHCIYKHLVSFTTTNQKTRNVFFCFFQTLRGRPRFLFTSSCDVWPVLPLLAVLSEPLVMPGRMPPELLLIW